MVSCLWQALQAQGLPGLQALHTDRRVNNPKLAAQNSAKTRADSSRGTWTGIPEAGRQGPEGAGRPGPKGGCRPASAFAARSVRGSKTFIDSTLDGRF